MQASDLQPRPNDPEARRVWDLLATVMDPEIPVLTIADLGVLRGVDRQGDEWVVTITPTYSGCPAMNAIESDVRALLNESGISARVETVYDPPWTTDWMSEAGRAKLKAYGIAPPVEASTSKRSLLGIDPEVACPQCDSTETRKLSEFGSTACKALYQCESCLQPFDYFKCL